MSEIEAKDSPGSSLATRVAAVSLLYLAVYACVSWADLFTTKLALQQPNTVEGNVYAVGDDGYSAAKAWGITSVGALFILPFLVFGLLAARRVSERWLQHPIRSFAKLYINPFSKKVIDRSPLHMLSFVLAFPVLRLLAAGNNWLISETGTGPIGWLVGQVSNATNPTLGFWLVLGPLFYLLAFACSPLAVFVLRRFGAGSQAIQQPPEIGRLIAVPGSSLGAAGSADGD
jgi:hypothetical protein